MIIIAYIIPAISTFLFIRLLLIGDEAWDNGSMLVAIVAGLIPILNWIGFAGFCLAQTIRLALYFRQKFNETEFSNKFYTWLQDKPKI